MAGRRSFKVDENCPVEFVAMLREQGHDASHVVEQRLGGSADDRVAVICRREGRAIVTLDVDFADIRTYPPRENAWIVVLRVDDQHKRHLPTVFERVLPLFATEPVAGWLWIVDESGVRVRAG